MPSTRNSGGASATMPPSWRRGLLHRAGPRNRPALPLEERTTTLGNGPFQGEPMNVLFVHLPLARRSYIAQFALPEPLAPMYLAPVLRARHRLQFVDLRLARGLERALARLGGFRPEAAVVGVAPLTLGSLGAVLAALRARFPELKILLHADAEYGNAHVSERPEDFLHPLADALVEPYFLSRQREIVAATLEAWEAGRELTVPGLWLRERGGWRATRHVDNVVGAIGVPDRSLLGAYRGRYRFGGLGRMAHLFYTYG